MVAGGTSHRGGKFAVSEDGQERGRHGFRITNWYELSAVRRVDNLVVPTDSGGDDWQAGGRRFDERDGQTFGQRGQRTDIGGLEQTVDIVTSTKKSRVGAEPQFVGGAFEKCALRTVAGQPQFRHWQLLPDQSECLQKCGEIFLGSQARHHNDGRNIFRKAELPADRWLIGWRAKLGRIHPVGEDMDCGRRQAGALGEFDLTVGGDGNPRVHPAPK